MSGGPNQRKNTRQIVDLHETPALAVRALIGVETLPEHIWEPCCGPGAIAREIRRYGSHVTATDLVDYQSHWQDQSGVDFLVQRQVPYMVSGIVMNPPYTLAPQFISHALSLVPNVYALLRLNFYAAVRKDYPNLYDRLTAVHVFKRRLPMMHRAGWTGRKASSQFDHAWLCWGPDSGHKATIDQIDWKV